MVDGKYSIIDWEDGCCDVVEDILPGIFQTLFQGLDRAAAESYLSALTSLEEAEELFNV